MNLTQRWSLCHWLKSSVAPLHTLGTQTRDAEVRRMAVNTPVQLLSHIPYSASTNSDARTRRSLWAALSEQPSVFLGPCELEEAEGHSSSLVIGLHQLFSSVREVEEADNTLHRSVS